MRSLAATPHYLPNVQRSLTHGRFRRLATARADLTVAKLKGHGQTYHP